MNLGDNIRRTRLERGMTQATLAEALGVSDRAVSRWERGTSVPDVALLTGLLAETLEKLGRQKDAQALRALCCP